MFDDEITVIEVSNEDLVDGELVEPPPLPFPLRREKQTEDERWLASLSPKARAVLEAARTVAPSWPIARRVPGAVAQPLQRIPSLSVGR